MIAHENQIWSQYLATPVLIYSETYFKKGYSVLLPSHLLPRLVLSCDREGETAQGSWDDQTEKLLPATWCLPWCAQN